MIHNYLPEEKLCILFSRLILSVSNREEIKRLLTEVKDWGSYFKLSNKHRIASLTYYHITELKFEKFIPKTYLEFFYEAFQNHKKRNLALFHDIEKLCHKFHKEKIKLVLLKGAALTPRIYKRIEIRPMSDFDFLIQRKDLKKAEVLLNEFGYTREKSLGEMLGRTVNKWERYKELRDSGHLAFFKLIDLPYKKSLCMEAHINLFRRSNYIFDDLTEPMFEGSRKSFFGDKAPCYYLNSVDEFLYLCSHVYYNFIDLYSVSKNTDIRLIRFCDLREYLKRKKTIKLEFHSLPDSLKESVEFSLRAIFAIYNEQYFSEFVDYAIGIDDRFNRIFWKIGNKVQKIKSEIRFNQRLFSMEAPNKISAILEKVTNAQTDIYLKMPRSLMGELSGKEYINCRQQI